MMINREMRLRNHRSRGDQTQKTCPRQTRTFTWKNQPSHSVQNPQTTLLSKTQLLQTRTNINKVHPEDKTHECKSKTKIKNSQERK